VSPGKEEHDVAFHRRKRIGEVDLIPESFGMVYGLLLNKILNRVTDHGSQVGCQNSRLEILENSEGRFSRNLLDFDAAFEMAVGGFHRPALGVQLFELSQRKLALVEEGSQQNDLFPVFQCEPEDANSQGIGAQVLLLTEFCRDRRRFKADDSLALSGAEEFFDKN